MVTISSGCKQSPREGHRKKGRPGDAWEGKQRGVEQGRGVTVSGDEWWEGRGHSANKGALFLLMSWHHHLSLLFCKMGFELDQVPSTFLGARAPKEGETGIRFHLIFRELFDGLKLTFRYKIKYETTATSMWSQEENYAIKWALSK